MGLIGLSTLLDGSPQRPSGHGPLTSMEVATLQHDLAAAMRYVFTAPAAAAAPPATAALVRDGQIDYAAVAAYVDAQQAQAAAAAAAAAAHPAIQQPASSTGTQPTAAQVGEPSCGGSSAAAASQPAALEPAASSAADPAAAEPGGSTATARPGSSEGRLGPAEVGLVEARGQCEIARGLCVLSRSNFSTVRSTVCVFKGRWQYEVQLGSNGIMQVGRNWCVVVVGGGGWEW